MAIILGFIQISNAGMAVDIRFKNDTKDLNIQILKIKGIKLNNNDPEKKEEVTKTIGTTVP